MTRLGRYMCLARELSREHLAQFIEAVDILWLSQSVACEKYNKINLRVPE